MTAAPLGSLADAHPADARSGLWRAIAARAAGMSGGAALIFATDGTAGSSRLRSAAGVESPEMARMAADAMAESVAQASLEGRTRQFEPIAAMGARGAGGTWLLPIGDPARCRGVILATTPHPASPVLGSSLELVAAWADAKFETASLRTERDALREQAATRGSVANEKSDEVLKLSEALFAQDIELLKHSERLGQVDKLKNDFIEKMSRELRTPLNSIIEAIISVLAGENDVLSDNAQQRLRGALDEGTAFLRTLQNILDLWRIRQGEMSLEIQEVNFREVVEEAIFSVHDTLGDNPVAIEKHFEEPLPVFRTDLAKLNHVLFLLLDNAAKFTAEGSIHIDARVEDRHLICDVRDTGIGICSDDRESIFDEFFQVDEATSTKFRGAGLGLALVRELLSLMEGGIAVSSEVGRGSSFTFRVPVTPVP